MADLRDRFLAALADLQALLERDTSVLAAVLCGSLAHDRVWEKSDIDLVVITVDDKKAPRRALSLVYREVNIHACLMPRTPFRQLVEGAERNSFLHSLLAKGRLLFTKDPTIANLCASLDHIGDRDTEMQSFRAASEVVPCLYKAQKWLRTRGDLDYTAVWLLHAATPLARLELLAHRRLLDREVLPQALLLNPAFFRLVYTDLLAGRTAAGVAAALAAVEAYLAEGSERWFQPLLAYLREAGEVRCASELEEHFSRTYGLEGVVTACEYLADLGLIHQAGAPVKLTRISNLEVQELAFFAEGAPPDAF